MKPFFLSILAAVLASLPAARADPVFRTQSFPGDLQEVVRRECREAYAIATGWFGAELRSPVVVRWVTDGRELRRHGVRPEDVAGVAVSDSSLILLYAPALAAGPERRQSVILHELCHLFVARATERAELLPPRWLNEGVAMHVSGEWDLGGPWRSDRDVLRDATAAGAIRPLAELDASFPDGPYFRVAYAQSLSFVEWLVRRGGEESLREMLRLLGDDLDPEPAFARVYGMAIEDAEREWLDSFAGPKWFRRVPSAGTIVAALWVVLALLMIAKFVRVRLQLRRATDDERQDWSGPWRG